jgi:superfamily II DNA or RNA helicase
MLGSIERTIDYQGRPIYKIEGRGDIMVRVKRIFPRAAARRTGAVEIHDTPEVARDLEWVISRWPLEVDPTTARHMSTRAQSHRDTEQLVREILSGGRSTILHGEPHCEHRDYQVQAANLCASTGALLLMDVLGLGKTITALLTLGAEDALPALIVVPTHMPAHWIERLQMVWPLLTHHVLDSLTPYDPSERRGMHGHDPNVLISSYGKLRGWGDTLAGKVNTVIFDEVQALRREGSERYIAAAQIADQAKYAMGLSATPIYNYGGEIYNIMDVLSPDALGTREEFAREWCGGYWHDGKTSVRDPEALAGYLRESGLILRRNRKEVGRELPQTVPVTHAIDTSEERFDALMVTAQDLALKITKADGTKRELFTMKGDFDYRMRHATGLAKAPFVADFVRMLLETDEPVVLWGWHRDVYDVWLQRLADHNPVMYTGSESPAQKKRAEEAFINGDTNLLIMSLRSGEGIDGLQTRCKVGVFGELDWSPGAHKQCIGRIERDDLVATENDPPVVYYLVSSLGSDPVMADVLDLKEAQAQPFDNPDKPLFESVKDDGDRVRRLAEEFLKRSGSAA